MQHSLNIWKVTDGKPGHESQTDGLIAAIRALRGVTETIIHVNKRPNIFPMFFCWLFRNRPSVFPAGTPDLIIGAGHRTHSWLLLARSLCGGKTIVLMKPSLPLKRFDYVVVPKHDYVQPRANVIETKGMLNAVTFVLEKDLQKGLMLIGGKSKHYEWDGSRIATQVKKIVDQDKKVRWTLTTSRRTPESFLQLLEGLEIEIVPFEETDVTWLLELYKASGKIWVTPDSVSMVYESLSSGAMTSVFSLAPSKAPSRVRNGLEQLMKNTLVGSFDALEDGLIREQAPSEFNESERVANIILDDIT